LRHAVVVPFKKKVLRFCWGFFLLAGFFLKKNRITLFKNKLSKYDRLNISPLKNMTFKSATI
jgi:hypothetical protein